MGSSNSTAIESVDGKMFGPNGNLMDVDEMNRIQQDLKHNYPSLSYVSENEKRMLKPKLDKIYDLVDVWRSDIDLDYRHALNRMKAAAEYHARPQRIAGSLVSILFVLPGLKESWSIMQIGNVFKQSAVQQNDLGAFLGKGNDAVQYLLTIGSNVTASYKQASTFESLLLTVSNNMRTMLCSPTEAPWKSLRQLSSLEIDTNLYLYNAIRTAMADHTKAVIYGYVFSTKFHFVLKVGETTPDVYTYDSSMFSTSDTFKSEIKDFMSVNPVMFWEGTKIKRCECSDGCKTCGNGDEVYHPRTWRGVTVYAKICNLRSLEYLSVASSMTSYRPSSNFGRYPDHF